MKFEYNGETHELILLTLSGSRFYGTWYDSDSEDKSRHHPFIENYKSDEDMRGIFISPVSSKIGLKDPLEEIIITGKPEDLTDEKMKLIDHLKKQLNLNLDYEQDITLYEISKFVKLSMEQNPNILDVLFTDKEAIFYETKKGKKLRKKGSKIFMSLKTKFTFSGYALSQLNRIRGTIQYSDKTLKILYKALENGDINEQWLKDNFKGMHEKKLIHNYNRVSKAEDKFSAYEEVTR